MERVYQRRLEAGWRRKRRWRRGALPREWRETKRERGREKSSNTSRVPLSLCSSIVQAECTPNLLHPYPQKHPPLLCSFSAPSLPPPLHQLSDLCSAPCSPLLSLSLSLPLHRSIEKWRKDETLQRGKKINNTDG